MKFSFRWLKKTTSGTTKTKSKRSKHSPKKRTLHPLQCNHCFREKEDVQKLICNDCEGINQELYFYLGGACTPRRKEVHV